MTTYGINASQAEAVKSKPNYWKKKKPAEECRIWGLMIITWNAVVISSVSVNNFSISTKAITCVKYSQWMSATKCSKQITCAAQPVWFSAPLFSITGYFDTFLTIVPLPFTSTGCYPFLWFQWPTKEHVTEREDGERNKINLHPFELH